MNFIIPYLKFLLELMKILKRKWIIEIHYPKKYPNNHLKSIIPEQIQKTNGLFIESNVTIKNPKINIGRHTYIGNNTIIDACSSIGSFSSISFDVKIGLRNHPLNHISTSPLFYSKYRRWLQKSSFDERDIKNVRIDEDVLISANAVVISGVHIGRGAVIGAGAIVNKDVPPYAIVVGVPAKIIRYRFSPDHIQKIEKSKWWEKDDECLKKFMKFSNNPQLFISKISNYC